MKNRIIPLLLLAVLVALMSVPAVAAGVEVDGGLAHNTYYAFIPYDTMAFTNGMATYYSGAQGQYYFRTSEDFDPTLTAEPSRVSMVLDFSALEFEDYNTASAEQYKMTYTQEYYSQPSQYYATTNRFAPLIGGFESMTFQASSFGITLAMYNTLCSYAYMYLPAGVKATVTATATYYSLRDNEWYKSSSSVTQTVTASVAGNYRYYPSGLFSSSLDYPNGNIVVDNFTLHVQFSTFIGSGKNVSFGMLYGRQYNGTALMSQTVATEVIEKIVEVPAEELDLFGWIISPISAFFGLEFFPGISLGSIIGVFVAISFVLIFLKFFGGG